MVQKDEDVEFFREKFAGSQADRDVKDRSRKEITEQLGKQNLISNNNLIPGSLENFYDMFHIT